MFFPLSKALAFGCSPATWAMLLLALAAALFAGRRLRAAVIAAASAFLVALAFSTPAVAGQLERWAESSAKDTFRRDGGYDTIVIVGGGSADDPRVDGAGAALLAGLSENVLYSGRISRRTVDRLVARFRGWGLDDRRFVIEARSRNTRENAQESARIVAERGWRRVAIVTSAAHVERALGCYRAVGLDPDVLVVDRRAPAEQGVPPDLWPSREALRRSRQVMHELAGRLVYRAMGYTR